METHNIERILPTEESKYYIPSIKEFHVGFECELHTITVGGLMFEETVEHIAEPTIPVWDKYTFRKGDVLSPIGLELTRLSEMLANGQVRVKHLDREDIEGEGFVNMGIHAESKWDVFHKGQYILLEKDRFIVITDNKNEITLFNGTIKNKSELKRILKQIGI